MVGIQILTVLSLRRVGNKTRLVVCFLEQKHLTHSNKMVHLIGGKQQAQVLCGSRGHDLTISLNTAMNACGSASDNFITTWG